MRKQITMHNDGSAQTGMSVNAPKKIAFNRLQKDG